MRVTATGSVALFLAAHLPELLAALGPEVELGVTATRTRVSLERREAEIAPRMRRLPEHGPLAARRLGRLAFAPYTRASKF